MWIKIVFSILGNIKCVFMGFRLENDKDGV